MKKFNFKQNENEEVFMMKIEEVQVREPSRFKIFENFFKYGERSDDNVLKSLLSTYSADDLKVLSKMNTLIKTFSDVLNIDYQYRIIDKQLYVYLKSFDEVSKTQILYLFNILRDLGTDMDNCNVHVVVVTYL